MDDQSPSTPDPGSSKHALAVNTLSVTDTYPNSTSFCLEIDGVWPRLPSPRDSWHRTSCLNPFPALRRTETPLCTGLRRAERRQWWLN
eukprot:858656-Rhodomonas_salina.2